jgi:CheY-like chemotaxis protein
MPIGPSGVANVGGILDNRLVEKGTASAAMANAETGTPGERRAVLIVDSDPAVRRILRLVLEGAGVSCVACANAHDAVSMVGTYEPKLVLAEVRLEEEGGQELAKALATSKGWRPRIALMSAYPRPRRGHEDFFLKKPIEFDRLLQLVETVDRGTGW